MTTDTALIEFVEKHLYKELGRICRKHYNKGKKISNTVFYKIPMFDSMPVQVDFEYNAAVECIGLQLNGYYFKYGDYYKISALHLTIQYGYSSHLHTLKHLKQTINYHVPYMIDRDKSVEEIFKNTMIKHEFGSEVGQTIIGL